MYDGFLIIIIDSTDIEGEGWCNETFKHNYFKFMLTPIDHEIDFLEVKITLENNHISTTLSTKPKANGNYLSYFSNHPKHSFKSSPYSQGIRIRRICQLILKSNDVNDEMNHKF